MAHGLGHSVFRSPPATPTRALSRSDAPAGFGQQGQFIPPPQQPPAPEPSPQERAETIVKNLARDLDKLQNMVRGQVNEAKINGRDIQRIFGPESGVRQQIERQIDTFRNALQKSGRDPLIADRSRDLILGEIPPPETQITKTSPGEDIQLITAGPGGSRTAERIGGTAPLPTVIQQGGTLAETRTGRVLARGSPIPTKADTTTLQVRDKQGNLVSLLISKKDGTILAVLGRGPELRFVPETVPGIGREELAKLDEAEIGVTNAIRGAFELRENILAGGAEVLGAPGGLSGLAQGFVSQTLGFAKLVGVNIDLFESGVSADQAASKADSIFARIDKAGTINAEIRSAIVNLAFAAAAASGQTGRGVSDRDYERFVRELGAGASKPEVFASVLTKFAQRLNDNFTTRFKVKMRRIQGGGELVVPNLFKEIFGASVASAAPAAGDQSRNAAGLRDGITATNPDTGETLVTRDGKWVKQ